MKPIESMSAGVVLERRKIDSPWQDYAWYPVAVIPGAPPVTEWRVLRHGEGWVHYHAGTLEIELHRKETEGYRVNLAQAQPRVFVVLRPDEEDKSGHDVSPSSSSSVRSRRRTTTTPRTRWSEAFPCRTR